MNSRDYKQFATGEIYHIFNRGTAKMNIFIDKDDFFFFLARMKEAFYPETYSRTNKRSYMPKLLPPNSFKLVAYCLMPNHFHLVIQQETELEVGKVISKICTGYGKYFNKKYSRVGGVFQDQFKAVLVENNEQLLYLSCYVHRNPLKAGLVQDLGQYAFSSYPEYIKSRDTAMCENGIVLKQFRTSADYKREVMRFDENRWITDLQIDGEYDGDET